MKNEIINYSFLSERSPDTSQHQDIEILMMLEGDACIDIDNETCRLKQDDILLINSYQQHRIYSDHRFFAVSYLINRSDVASLLQTSRISFRCSSVTGESTELNEIRKLIRQAVSLYFETDSRMARVRLISIYYSIIEILFLNFTVQVDDSRESLNRLDEIEDYISANYAQPLKLDEVARKFYISPGYFSRYLKRYRQQGFKEYLDAVRMSHAVDDLLYTDKLITDIIIDNGFAGAASFNHLFHEKYKMTPTEYRAQNKTDVHDAGQNKQTDLENEIKAYLAGRQGEEEPDSDNVLELKVRCDAEGRSARYARMINIGRIRDIANARVQEHILIFAKELGFTHFRVWNLFDPENLETDRPDEFYNFDDIDRAFDFLIYNGVHPFIELEFKPLRLHRDLAAGDALEPWRDIYGSTEVFAGFVRAFARHVVSRYGIDEICKWFFELWWPNGVRIEAVGEEQYFERFEILYSALKSYSGDIRVGGFGAPMGIRTFDYQSRLITWSARRIRPDFISIYCYPYSNEILGNSFQAYRSTDSDYIKHHIEMVKGILDNTSLKDIPVIVTQWNSTLSSRSVMNDRCFKGAYIVKNMMSCIENADRMSYWFGSDLFGYAQDSKTVCFGNSGLLTVNSIRKPAFYAFDFMNRLQSMIIGQNEYAIISTNNKDRYTIVCHNNKNYGYKFYVYKENQLNTLTEQELFENFDSIVLKFTVVGVPNGRYQLRHHYINGSRGSVLDEMKGFGEAQERLSEEDSAYLKNVSIPGMFREITDVSDGSLTVMARLEPNEIRVISIEYKYQ